jgi:hypothetical protein
MSLTGGTQSSDTLRYSFEAANLAARSVPLAVRAQ